VVSVPPGFYDNPTVPCTNCTNLAVVKNINFDGPFGATVPYAQGLATVGYQFRPNSYADVTGTYYGHNNTYFRPAFVDWDAHLGVPVNTNVSLLFTLRNITGIYGDAVQFLSPSIMSGAPTVSGPPYPLYGEAFGPRTLELTATYHI
jgi:hypothetical protein